MIANDPDIASEFHARALDAADPLANFRARFYLPPGVIYLDGNSLGLLSRDAEAATLAALDDWKRLAIDGWLRADPDWFTIGEQLGALTGAARRRDGGRGRRHRHDHRQPPQARRHLLPAGAAPPPDRRRRARLPLRRLRAAKPDSPARRRPRRPTSSSSRAATVAPSTSTTSSAR